MINNFIGGGQVFLHKVRMFEQVFFRTLNISIIVGLIASIGFHVKDLQRYSEITIINPFI